MGANIIYFIASGSRTTYGSERRNFGSAGGMGNDFTGKSGVFDLHAYANGIS